MVFLCVFNKIVYEIQYLTAYISGNMHPIPNIQIDSNRSYLKLFIFILKVKLDLLVFRLLSLKVGQNPNLPKSKYLIFF
jgi:hypothetical protein